MDSIYQFVEDFLGISQVTTYKILLSAFILFTLFIVRFVLRSIVNSLKKTAKSKYHLRNSVSYLVIFVGFILLFKIWFNGFGALATYLGLLSAGIAIALKDPLVDLAAWLFILVWRPFEVGDRIEIGKIKGDVVNTNLFQFTLNEVGEWVNYEQSTGRLVHIPNSKVFTESQANYTQEFSYIWNEIPVLITFESDWRKTKTVLTNIINEFNKNTVAEAKKSIARSSKRNLIYFGKLTPIVWTDVQDSGVLLTIRYLCNPYKRRTSQAAIWELILDEFAKDKTMDLAYPTLRQIRTGGEIKIPVKTTRKTALKKKT